MKPLPLNIYTDVAKTTLCRKRVIFRHTNSSLCSTPDISESTRLYTMWVWSNEGQTRELFYGLAHRSIPRTWKFNYFWLKLSRASTPPFWLFWEYGMSTAKYGLCFSSECYFTWRVQGCRKVIFLPRIMGFNSQNMKDPGYTRKDRDGQVPPLS